MDAKEAVVAARNHITSDNRNLANVQLDLEEVVPDPARRDWRVILSFTPPGGQQGQQGASTSRDYKKVIVSDTNGAMVSMSKCTPYISKSASAGQSVRSRASGRWLRGAKSLRRALVTIPLAAMSVAIIVLLFLQPALGDTAIEVINAFIMPGAYVMGLSIGYVIAALRY